MSRSSASGLHAPGEQGQQLVPALGSCLRSGWQWQQLMAMHKSPNGSAWPLSGQWRAVLGPCSWVLPQWGWPTHSWDSWGSIRSPLLGLSVVAKIWTLSLVPNRNRDRVLGEVEKSSFYCFPRHRGPQWANALKTMWPILVGVVRSFTVFKGQGTISSWTVLELGKQDQHDSYHC